ncbi:hypothetical protein [Devosia sp. 63-57]|mgnify:CR=1 FL=1|uniref:hypothetical protein n=1 Tax=Devosia sp. 63-57 TaxID=1895751 RepID=UPI00257CD6C1|nr:hypothetical protein [Devosia sp. 63-57]
MEPQTEKRVASTRTKKRSRSGAQTPCPHCDKKLRGEKGLKAHIAEAHGDGK